MRLWWIALVALSLAAISGCEPPPPPMGGFGGPADVEVSTPISKSVTEYEDFTGMSQAIHTIEVRARVSGYLSKVLFEEGAEVKEGDLLFEIDPGPYAAELARAKAAVAQTEAHRRRLEFDFGRARRLLQTGAMGQEDYDKVSGDLAEAGAAVGVARAQQQTADLNMGYTKVHAPISGRISHRLIDPGNMVKADETALTTIVSIDPMYANFDVDETNALKLIRQGKIKTLQSKRNQTPAQRLEAAKALLQNADGFDVSLGLGDEEGFPHKGKVDFVENQIDASTGTLRLRGVFSNSDRLLSPGLFVRIRLPIAPPHTAVLVSEQALARDQGQKKIYVVDAENKPSYRQVKVGRLYDGFREILEGLKPGERVVVKGLQRVREGMPVNATEVLMPAPGQESTVKTKEAADRSPSAGGKAQ
jgi:membrane fusion protein, multidrug efflux system